ncbi:MAG: flagellar protein FlaG [Gammaproteobacteria bacterium]|nr:flagellar protein FlaG [Gammaproteobacteria bacterium]
MSSEINANASVSKLNYPQSKQTENNVMTPRGLQTEDVQAKVNESVTQKNDINKMVDDVNEYVRQIHHNLSFSVDKDLGRTIIRVVDVETDKMIRQIPSEEFLEIAKAIEKTKSLLMKVEA